MEIELLYFDGCPSYRTAEKILWEVLAKKGMEADVELVAVNSDEEARRLRFPGSPTIRVGGQDLFPVAEREDWSLGCRVYATPGGLKGFPTAEMLREALRR
ncbi:MAG: thioredoxin family protein [Actinomycetota bacterium]|nr:thioredoxin family protein [Actinomycetota bacterium]